MGIKVEVEQKKAPFFQKTCLRCREPKGPESFVEIKNKLFYPDGYLPICLDCIKNYLVKNDFSWTVVDKLCQYIDIPFIPKEFERIHKMAGEDCFGVYANLFFSAEFEGLGWGVYFSEFKKLEEAGILRAELPLISDEQQEKLRTRWGHNYDAEALLYLEDLFNGLMTTQNVNGKLQDDQALKLCKISYEIDEGIRSGDDIDKLLGSYEKLVKLADFTPKNVKNINDFDSTGELFKWLEKAGWRAKYKVDESKDVVDETLKNIQNYYRSIYINESGIGEEITHRLELLRNQDEENHYYDTTGIEGVDYDKYEDEGFMIADDEEFKGELE